MYNSTHNYLKQQILALIEQTNDTEHEKGRVTIHDIQKIVDEIKRPPGSLGYHDVEKYYYDWTTPP